MIRVALSDVLVYMDGIQLAVFTDVLGGKYLGLLAPGTIDQPQYLCVRISGRRIVDIRNGAVSLRSAFTSPELTGAHRGVADFTGAGTISLELDHLPAIPEDWLPTETANVAAMLEPVSADAEELKVAAINRGRPVVQLLMNPPESRGEFKIGADRLAAGILAFQRLIRHAYSRARKAASATLRTLLTGGDGCEIEAVGLVHGSFGVEFQAKQPGDLYGDAPLALALSKLDEFAEVINDPVRTLAVARANPGHFVAAYRALLSDVVAADSPIKYRWTLPSDSRVITHSIGTLAAGRAYDVLSQSLELSSEVVNMVGAFIDVKQSTKAWRFRCVEGGRERSGVVDESQPDLLNNITINPARYSIRCIERLNDTVGASKPDVELVLTAATRLDGLDVRRSEPR